MPSQLSKQEDILTCVSAIEGGAVVTMEIPESEVVFAAMLAKEHGMSFKITNRFTPSKLSLTTKIKRWFGC